MRMVARDPFVVAFFFIKDRELGVLLKIYNKSKIFTILLSNWGNRQKINPYLAYIISFNYIQ